MSLVIDSGFNYDADASAYIDAVEAADGQALETATRYAINDFVIGCKQDGIWSAIKASCILAGARTLAGCLVPLVGTAPSRQGTEGGWTYNRKNGLQGNGTNNYINSNRADDADPQNDKHYSVYVPTGVSNGRAILGGLATSPNRFTQILDESNTAINFSLNSTGGVSISYASLSGLLAANRSSASQITTRLNKASATHNYSSVVASSQNIYLLARNLNGSPSLYESKPLAFYSIGESLDLAKLDGRVTDLMNAFAAAIP